MTELLFCDICGRSEKDLIQENHTTPIEFQMDEDDLWVCSKCQKNLSTLPTNQADEDALDDRIKELVGKKCGGYLPHRESSLRSSLSNHY